MNKLKDRIKHLERIIQYQKAIGLSVRHLKIKLKELKKEVRQ